MILNGVIHTMEGKTIDNGYIRVENGKIQQVGRMDQLPDGAELENAVDARGGHVLPGLMDIHCHLGLCGCDGEDLNETSQVCTPNIRVLDGVNPMDPYVKEARAAGVTCVMVHPGSTNPVAGQAVLMKTAGRIVDEMVVQAPAAMKFSLGENPKAPNPYVTWRFNEQDGHRDYFWGHYHNEPDMAERDLHNRAEDYQRRYHVQEVEQAPDKETYKYYSTQRPIAIGT